MEALGIEISWPLRKPREKPSRLHNHHVSLRDRIQELKHHPHHPPKAGGAGGDKETTAKAVAWAVFQHHGEGSGLHHGHAHGLAVRRPTRFKIEAQMRHELAHRSVYEAAGAKWDAGSTLFDSFELHSLLKTLDDAAHTPTAPQKSHGDGEDAGAMVVYTPPKSPSRWTSDENNPRAHGEVRQRYSLTANVKHGLEHHQEDASPVFDHWRSRRSFDSASEKPIAKAGDSHHHHHHHHHSKWKNLLHTLHLDGAHGLFHKSHKQVAPHDLEQKSRLRQNHGHSQDGQYFERNDLFVSKDVNPPAEKEEDPHRHHHHHHQPHFWKFGFKPFCRAGHATLSDSEGSDCEDPHPMEYHGHRQTDLRKAWSSLTANFLHLHHHHDSPAVIEHHHHHHHHHQHEEVQATSRRASRDERVRRVSSEEGGLKTPRNSLETVVVSVCT